MQKSALLVLVVASLLGCGSNTANTAQPVATEPAAEQPVEQAGEPPVVIPAGSTYDDATARACTAPSDCTLVPGVCGAWVGANASHAEAARAHWANLAMAASCAVDPTLGTIATVASCDDSLCEPLELDHPEWRACSTAADCVAVHDVCGGIDAVNRASEAAMHAEVQQRAMRVRCMSTTEGPLPAPVCRGSFCVAY